MPLLEGGGLLIGTCCTSNVNLGLSTFTLFVGGSVILARHSLSVCLSKMPTQLETRPVIKRTNGNETSDMLAYSRRRLGARLPLGLAWTGQI